MQHLTSIIQFLLTHVMDNHTEKKSHAFKITSVNFTNHLFKIINEIF